MLKILLAKVSVLILWLHHADALTCYICNGLECEDHYRQNIITCPGPALACHKETDGPERYARTLSRGCYRLDHPPTTTDCGGPTCYYYCTYDKCNHASATWPSTAKFLLALFLVSVLST